MMWNQNDTKYIIKRLILYALISCIVFFGAQSCAKAQTISYHHWSLADDPASAWQIGQSTQWNVQGSPFKNGNGNLVFTIYQAPTAVGVEILNEIIVGDGTHEFTCNLGTQGFYNDNSTQRYITSVVCPVSFNSNGWRTITLKKPGAGILYLMTSEYADLTTDQASAVSGLSTQLTSIIDKLEYSNNISSYYYYDIRTQLIPKVSDIYNAISSGNSGITTAINNQTTSITNEIDANTSAINDVNSSIQSQTNWQQQDFQFDTSWSDSLDLFGNDTNYIRQLLLWPFTFSLVIGQSLSGNVCSAYTFGSLYGTQLTLPCINWKNYVGNTIYTIIDTIMGIVILFGVITYIRKVFEYVFSFGAKAYETVDVEVFK